MLHILLPEDELKQRPIHVVCLNKNIKLSCVVTYLKIQMAHLKIKATVLLSVTYTHTHTYIYMCVCVCVCVCVCEIHVYVH